MYIRLGDKYVNTNHSAAETIEKKDRASATGRAGREITDSECQILEPATDSRSFHEKVNSQKFRVKLKTDSLTPLESLLADATERVAGQNPYKGMSSDEAMATMISDMVDDERDAVIREELKAEHLDKVAPQLAALDAQIEKENWSATSDQKFREQLSQARQTLCEPNACPTDLRQRMRAIDTILEDRAANRQGELLQRQASLQNELFATETELGTFTKPTRVEIDRSLPLTSQGHDLYDALKDTNEADRAFEANEAHRNGNSQPLESMIDEVTNE